MLDAFRYLLCSKLCWHNLPVPNLNLSQMLSIYNMAIKRHVLLKNQFHQGRCNLFRGNKFKIRNSLGISNTKTTQSMGLDVPLVSEDPSWTVCDELLKKHPKGQPAHSAALKSLDSCGERFHLVIFKALNGALIRNAALCTRGAAGPSSLDTFGWRLLCISFQRVSDDLCCFLTLVSHRLCTSCVDPDVSLPWLLVSDCT